jgi:Na+/proline symporter
VTLLDSLIVVAFIAYSVSVGFVHQRKASQNLEEYFLAGRSLRGWQAGISMAATQYAADTPLLVAGLVATAGIFTLWRLWVFGVAFLLMGFVLGPAWRRARVLTDAELTELRYSGRLATILRAVKAIHLGTVVNCTVLAMVLIAATRIAEVFLPWHLWLPRGPIDGLARLMERTGFWLTTFPADHPEAWTCAADNLISISLIVAFTWLYSTTGGLRSVVSTDVGQFAIMVVATAVYAAFVLWHVGGLDVLPARLASLYGVDAAGELLSFGPPRWDEATALFCAVLAVQWFAQVNADGTGYLAQRTMACRSDRDTKAAATTFAFAQVLLRSLLWLPIILGLLVLYPAHPLPAFGTASEAFRVEREALFATGIRDLLPVGARGLILTGMLAALASTVDTHLNWGASYWANDLYKRFVMGAWLKRTPSPRELVWVARLSSVGILVVALLIGMRLSSIQSAWHVSLLVGSGLGVVSILRWLWYRINVYSELAAALVSLLLSPILLFGFPRLSEGARLLWMTTISTAAVMGVTLLTKPESTDTLTRFYARARPPGFWQPVAGQLGEDPGVPQRELWRAVRATALASVTLFCLLVGAGAWLTQLPQGSPLTHPVILLAIGVTLVPLWVRLAFRQPSG